MGASFVEGSFDDDEGCAKPLRDDERRARPRAKAFAPAVAVCRCGGVGAASGRSRARGRAPEGLDDDDSLGAPAIEIGLELASTRSEPTDLPPGPDSDASVASPALAEQKAEVKETDLPKDTPAEEAEADRVVTPNDVKKPVEEEAKVAKVETQASQESVAAEATAAPSLDNAPKAQRSVAPAIGTGMAARRVRATWQKELVAHLDRHKRYPGDRAAKEAEILVGLVLDRMGHVLSTNIVKGSGDAAFDQAALSMIHRSDPVPAPPPLVADEGLNFTLPVIFKVKSKS